MLSRTTFRVARQQVRLLSTSRILLNKLPTELKTADSLAEVTSERDLIGKGAKAGTIPTDFEQSTGLQRLELLGKREGVDVFDMENPICEGTGTFDDPLLVPTFFGYRYVGCRGKGDDEHKAYWMKVEDGKKSRCWHCGTVLTAKYLGEESMHHH
ncbi:COX4 [[Candida] subhashii]|uniref:COX4 n=1 Tax=[Candida] subhashii TaxID=561895 RepID=A0A8J5URE6_9ASCO|nr:COX4 [[Candida] subhashii]KAG7665491.1 COX4 [[Candida] subhashii]